MEQAVTDAMIHAKTYSSKVSLILAAILILPGVAAAASAVAKRPASIHASPNTNAKVLGLIGVSQVVDAKSCKKGWCKVSAGKVSGGYVQLSYLRFIQVPKGYDYNVPLALRPYGYVPGFWGYGGRRYYDKHGNYTKYGARGYAGTENDRLGGTVQTVPRGRLGRR